MRMPVLCLQVGVKDAEPGARQANRIVNVVLRAGRLRASLAQIRELIADRVPVDLLQCVGKVKIYISR